MSLISRTQRHLRLTKEARDREPRSTPPFLILFINSICNLSCDHCFYWKELNQRNDLTFEEFETLSQNLDPIENLNLSGGEPFLHPQFAEINSLFVRNNSVKRIYCPTNGYFTDRTVDQLRLLFKEESLDSFTIELSLDGMVDFHNTFRGNKQSFEKAMETYDALAELQENEPRLEIHAISTATGENIDEIKELTSYLFERCPKMTHHNIAMIRGERKRPTLQGPGLQQYRELIAFMAKLWKPREESRFGSIVDPLLHRGKIRIAKSQSQAIPCCAGKLTGVVHANGDIAVCEAHAPIGNLRKNSFTEIWNSVAAQELRASIRAKECFCTNEVFLWPSIVFQPTSLVRTILQRD